MRIRMRIGDKKWFARIWPSASTCFFLRIDSRESIRVNLRNIGVRIAGLLRSWHDDAIRWALSRAPFCGAHLSFSLISPAKFLPLPFYHTKVLFCLFRFRGPQNPWISRIRGFLRFARGWTKHFGGIAPQKNPPPTEFILDTTREGTRIGTHGNPCLLLNPARTTSQATRPYGPAAAPRSQPNPSPSLEYQFLTKNKLGHWRPAQPGCDSFSGRPYPCRPYGLVAWEVVLAGFSSRQGFSSCVPIFVPFLVA